MGYKLICIDLDGTLLNSKKQITEATKATLQKAHHLGVHIVISTGRIYADAEYYSNLIGVKSPVITANGAYIKEKSGDGIIYQNVLGAALAGEILQICKKYHVTPHFYTPRKEYYGSMLFTVIRALGRLRPGMRRAMTRAERKYIATHAQWVRVIVNEKDHLVKCALFHHNRKKIRKIRYELSQVNELEVASSGWNIIELNYKGISKGKGVEILTHYYNLTKDEVMAIGDGENDLSMIEYAGLGVAMGNATDLIKEKADYITDTNDHDGVAKVIEKFILNPSLN